MYKINSDQLLAESEVLMRKAHNLESCLDKLEQISCKIAELNNDDNIRDSVNRLKDKMKAQQTKLIKFSHVVSSAANVALNGNRQALMICSHETELQNNLVSKMLGSGNETINPTSLPINISIN